MFDFKRPFELSMLSNPPWTSIDLFVHHSVWNYEEVHRVLPTAFFVSILREPVACFESNYVYMGLQGVFKMDINEFATTKAALGVSRSNLTLPETGITRIIGKNQQLWDLGLDAESMEEPMMVSTKIKELDENFDFVLLADRFDEGLVVLAKKLCWDLKEVRYLRQNSRKADKVPKSCLIAFLSFNTYLSIKSLKNADFLWQIFLVCSLRRVLFFEVSKISPEAQEGLTNWLEADYRLYRHFEEKFQHEVQSYGGEALARDVAQLRALNKQLTDECVQEMADNSKLKGEFKTALNNGLVEGYLVDPSKPWCNPFAISEPSFTKKVRQRQNMSRTKKDTRGRQV